MFNFLNKLNNRFVRFKNHDRFSFLYRDRRKHLSFVNELESLYPKPHSMASIGNYALPEAVLNSLSVESIIITGGVEFHIDFEENLDDYVNASFHFFEVDYRSIQWFKEHKTRPNFKIIPKGLGAKAGTLPVFGNEFMGFSSSVDPKIYRDSDLNFDKIGESEITTVPIYCAENNISQIDLLKLDIEGMALEVLYSCWDAELFPKNVLLEIERGSNQDFESFEIEIDGFLTRASKLKYQTIFLKRNNPYNSFSAEFFLMLG